MTSLSHHNSAAELLRRYDLDDSRRKASGWKSLQKHRSSKRKVMPHSSSERALDTRKMVQDRPSSAHNAAVTVRPTGRGGLSYTKGQRPRTAMRTAVDSFQRRNSRTEDIQSGGEHLGLKNAAELSKLYQITKRRNDQRVEIKQYKHRRDRQSRERQRVEVNLQSQRMMEKNNMLRKELERLQFNRGARAEKKTRPSLRQDIAVRDNDSEEQRVKRDEPEQVNTRDGSREAWKGKKAAPQTTTQESATGSSLSAGYKRGRPMSATATRAGTKSSYTRGVNNNTSSTVSSSGKVEVSTHSASANSSRKVGSNRPTTAYARYRKDSLTARSAEIPKEPVRAKQHSASSQEPRSSTKSQYAEKVRLQSLVSSPDWDSQGRVDMYVFGKLLGQGSFGTVRLAHHKITGYKVAVKTYEKSKMKDDKQLRRCKQEIKLMERLNSNYVVRLFETIETSKRLHIVMEALTGGNLCNYVKSQKLLPEKEALYIFHQIMLGLEYLQGEKIVHRDIKLENILFDSHRQVKLVDFGFSVSTTDKKLRVFCGTPSYMAPEIIRRQEYIGFPVDVWSSGVLLYAMLCGRFPFTAKTYKELYKCILRGNFRITQSSVSHGMRKLINRMLVQDPKERITVAEILEESLLHRSGYDPDKHRSPQRTAQLISEDPNDDIKRPLVKQLVDFGFIGDNLIESVLRKQRNHLTATYYLLCMKVARRKEKERARRKSAENA